MLQSQVPRRDDIMEGFCDGSLSSDSACFAGVGTVLLQLYWDEFDVVHPLGSKRETHKMLCVYFSVMDVSPQPRSKLDNIHLLLLSRYCHVKRHGTVLSTVLGELCCLYVNGLERGDGLGPVAVKVVAICRDNLSIHKLAGHRQSLLEGEYAGSAWHRRVIF